MKPFSYLSLLFSIFQMVDTIVKLFIQFLKFFLKVPTHLKVIQSSSLLRALLSIQSFFYAYEFSLLPAKFYAVGQGGRLHSFEPL